MSSASARSVFTACSSARAALSLRCLRVGAGSRHVRAGGWKGRAYCSRTVSAEPVIVSSPHRRLDIPDTVGLAEYVMKDFAKYGDKKAFVNGVTGQETTYNQLQTQITRVASALVKSGLRKGDVVSIFSPNCPEFAVMYLAVNAIGGIVSALNPMYTSGELSHALKHAGAKLLVSSAALKDVCQEAVKDCPDVAGILMFGQAEGCRPFTDLLSDDGTSFPENLDFDCKEDLSALPYSSGTTGLPKGVMLTQYNVVSNIEQIRTEEVLPYGVDDTLVGVLPFFHIYGQVVVMLTGLLQGALTVTMPTFDPDLFLNIIQNHRATYLHLVPPLVLFLSQTPFLAKFDLSSIRNVMTAAAPISTHVMETFIEKLANKDMNFRQGYGLTESSPVTHCNPVKDYKYASIGVPVHNTEAKVVDVTTSETLGYGHEGELWVRGPQVMKGYLKNEKATSETVDVDGWLHTGDIGYCQPDGHFYITDRLKELIKVKGFQVAPAELEALLLQHPKVNDTAVIGIPDERSGELPRAYVVLKPDMQMTEEDIKAFVKGKVAPYKELSGGVEFITEVPKSASGKILRRYLKDAYLKK